MIHAALFALALSASGPAGLYFEQTTVVRPAGEAGAEPAEQPVQRGVPREEREDGAPAPPEAVARPLQAGVTEHRERT